MPKFDVKLRIFDTIVDLRVEAANVDAADAQVREMPLSAIVDRLKVGDVGYPCQLQSVPESCCCQFDLATGKIVNHCKECSTA